MVKSLHTFVFTSTFFLMLGAFLFSYIAIDGPINLLHSGIHFLIIALSLLHIARARSFNLGLSFSFFALLFFGVIPLLEYKLGISYHGASIPRDSSYLSASGLALLSSICFYIGYGLKKGIPVSMNAPLKVQYVNRLHYQLVYGATVIGVIMLSLYIATYYEFEFKDIFFRGFGEEIESTPAQYTLVNYFARPLLFNLIFLIILTRVKRRSIRDRTVYFLCVVLIFFLVSPFGIPRSLAGALYIPLLVLVIWPRLNSKYSILTIIILSVLFLAPVVDIFRFINVEPEIGLFQNFTPDYFFAGHFDAFNNLVQAIEWDFSSKGWQIMGALLFWIPRAAWPEKPIGTSFEFAEFAGFRSGNISFTLTADLFLDFGLFGVIVGMFFLGILYKRLDNVFAKPRKAGSVAAYIFAIGHLELAILGIYLLRGNFLSTFTFTVCVAFSLIVLRIVSGAVRSMSTALPLLVDRRKLELSGNMGI